MSEFDKDQIVKAGRLGQGISKPTGSFWYAVVQLRIIIKVWTVKKQVAWSGESCSLLDQVDGWVCVWGGMAAGCTMGRNQADGGNVLANDLLETLGP